MRKALAYLVHIFTGLGLIFGILALYHVSIREWRTAYNFLIFAVIVDSVDGIFARAVGVKHVLREIDGSLMDNIIDFLVWSVVPAYVLLFHDIVPYAWRMPVIILIAYASLYQFCHSCAKSSNAIGALSTELEDDELEDQSNSESLLSSLKDEDFYFRGFPSAWVIVIYIMLFSNTNSVLNLAILLLCGVLAFIPIKFVYPTRTKMWKKANIAITGLWLCALLASIFYKELPLWFLLSTLAYAIYYGLASTFLTIKLAKTL